MSPSSGRSPPSRRRGLSLVESRDHFPAERKVVASLMYVAGAPLDGHVDNGKCFMFSVVVGHLRPKPLRDFVCILTDNAKMMLESTKIGRYVREGCCLQVSQVGLSTLRESPTAQKA